MKTFILAASLVGGSLLSSIPALCLEPSNNISTRILLQVNGRSAPRQVSEKSTFYDGQRFRLEVKLRRSGYIYVLYQTNRDRARLIPASGEFVSSSSESGEYTTFPEQGWFRFDDDPGTEQVVVILASEPLAELDKAGEAGDEIPLEMMHRYSERSLVDSSGGEERGLDTTAPSVPSVKRILLRHEPRDGF